VGKDGYLLECGRYIERNPLKAGLEKELSRYRYSSFNFYARGESDKMVSPNPLYEELSNDKEERRRIYAGYIYERRLSEEALDSGFGL
jgi:putative transposase